MAPTTFCLLVVHEHAGFIAALRTLPVAERPVYVGRCHHWIHQPHLSASALTGTDDVMLRWNYLVVTKATATGSLALHDTLGSTVTTGWSIYAEVSDDVLDGFKYAQAKRQSQAEISLPIGWSHTNHSGLDDAVAPRDLEASLALESTPLGGNRDGPKLGLKELTRTLGTKHTGPVNMLNLLAYKSGQRQQYFKYIAAFAASVGSRYGGDAMMLGTPVTDWTSRKEEGAELAKPEAGGSGVWEDVALVYYPSIWHFAKMLDDPEYADADRNFKQGVLEDNPILCCTEVDVGYAE